jgi:hypothetical protein
MTKYAFAVSFAAHPTNAPAVTSQSPDAPRLMVTKGEVPTVSINLFAISSISIAIGWLPQVTESVRIHVAIARRLHGVLGRQSRKSDQRSIPW